jgi:hypothetical protein
LRSLKTEDAPVDREQIVPSVSFFFLSFIGTNNIGKLQRPWLLAYLVRNSLIREWLNLLKIIYTYWTAAFVHRMLLADNAIVIYKCYDNVEHVQLTIFNSMQEPAVWRAMFQYLFLYLGYVVLCAYARL